MRYKNGQYPVVDAHTHIFCWGENPKLGFLSKETQKKWSTRLVLWMTRLQKEKGDSNSEKLLNKLLKDFRRSTLDYIIVLAQDAVYDHDGTVNNSKTHFYVSNDYVLQLSKEYPGIIPGCSINPIRKDALNELERCYENGGRLVKIHTAIQGVNPELAIYEPFYKMAAELGVTLMFHTGYEHSCHVVSQSYTSPLRLARPLDCGCNVVAAHSGTCGIQDSEDYYPHFVEMMERYDNLFGDTAIMASLIRWNSLKKLSKDKDKFNDRIIHGSDYPFPPARLPYLLKIGLIPAERKNHLDMDLLIKRQFSFGPSYENKILDLLGNVNLSN